MKLLMPLEIDSRDSNGFWEKIGPREREEKDAYGALVGSKNQANIDIKNDAETERLGN